MPNAHRFALSALLVLGSAALAALVVSVSTPRYAGARVPPAERLPWPHAIAAADRRLPFAMLYVSSGCAHCSRAAVLVDSIVIATGMRGVVVTNDSRSDAEAYGRRLRLMRALVIDSGSALLHAIGTHAVPTLILFHSDGSRQLVVGFTSDARFRRALEELR
jgi:hypothetical protein